MENSNYGKAQRGRIEERRAGPETEKWGDCWPQRVSQRARGPTIRVNESRVEACRLAISNIP